MPKILIVTVIILYFYQRFDWIAILLAFLVSILVVILLQVIFILLKGKYHLYQLKKGKKINKTEIYNFINRLLRTVNYFLRLSISVEHFERFDANKHYLITPNHQSNTDVPILLEVLKYPVTYVAKIAISKLIIIKDFMKLIGSLYLNKDDMRGQIKVMQEVEVKLKNHESVVIFPEGKRSFTSEMNDFKPGTFKVATRTKCDILPITINNAYKLKDNYPWRRTDIKVYIHEPITYETYKDMSTQEIASMVKKIVEAKVEYE